jgi:uncharacterized protein YlzI (FlbEa/FlbD family)
MPQFLRLTNVQSGRQVIVNAAHIIRIYRSSQDRIEILDVTGPMTTVILSDETDLYVRESADEIAVKLGC